MFLYAGIYYDWCAYGMVKVRCLDMLLVYNMSNRDGNSILTVTVGSVSNATLIIVVSNRGTAPSRQSSPRWEVGNETWHAFASRTSSFHTPSRTTPLLTAATNAANALTGLPMLWSCFPPHWLRVRKCSITVPKCCHDAQARSVSRVLCA